VRKALRDIRIVEAIKLMLQQAKRLFYKISASLAIPGIPG
jgi:hypothetical protein